MYITGRPCYGIHFKHTLLPLDAMVISKAAEMPQSELVTRVSTGSVWNYLIPISNYFKLLGMQANMFKK